MQHPLPAEQAALAEQIVRDLQAGAGTLAVFLTGSHVRAEADGFSDLDLCVLVASDKEARSDLIYRGGVLVSVERSTLAHRERAFHEPETALWNLTALRTGVPLFDPGGVFAALQARARALVWADLSAAASTRATQHLTGCVEQLHKVMGGLIAGDDGKVAFALTGLTFALGSAALLSTGTLISTENRYLTLARDAWPDPAWQGAYACLTGLTGEPLRARGRAALTAYGRAAVLTSPPGDPEEALIREAARRAEAFLTR